MFNMESILMFKLLGIDLGSSNNNAITARLDALEKRQDKLESATEANTKAIGDLVLVSQRLANYRQNNGNNGNNGNNNGGQKP